MRFSFDVFLIILVSFTLGSTSQLPSIFQKCAKDDKACLKSSIEKGLKQMKEGIKSLGIPPIDPIEIPNMTIGQGEGSVHVVQKYEHGKLLGHSDGKVEDIDINFKDKTLKLELLLEKLIFNAQYEFNGQVFFLPVRGKGPANLKLGNVTLTIFVKFEETQKSGKTFWKGIEVKETIKPRSAVYKFDNLFDGDERLSKQLHEVINENWSEVFDDVKFGYEEAFGKINFAIISKFFSKVPISEMFL